MFAPDIEDAIQRFAEDQGISREEALAMLVRDWLIGQGILLPEEEEPAERERSVDFT